MAITAMMLGRDPETDDEIYVFKREDGSIVKFGQGSSGTLKQLEQLRTDTQMQLDGIEVERTKQINQINIQVDGAKVRGTKQAKELSECMDAIKALV